jgi:redox-sensitive bicupin YhaK (pirin superfamily)
LDAGTSIIYNSKKNGNGLYLLVIDGDVTIADAKLKQRDAIGITDFNEIRIEANTSARLLAIDVPMIKLGY